MSVEIRLLYAGLTALLFGLIAGPIVIPWLRYLKVGQTVREDGPATHLKKSGTPTMGGVLFLLAMLMAVVIWTPRAQTGLAIAWVWLVLGFGVIGFMDDYVKVVRKQSLGLRARDKLVGQVIVGTIFFFMVRQLGLPTYLTLPYIGGYLDLGWFYLPFLIFLTIAASNAVNLIDGVDGLASTTVIVSAIAFILVALVAEVPVVAVLLASLIGGLLAFLRFNWHPARVFMGDVGSLALGGALAGAAVLTKTELLLAVIGLVYVVVTLSVMIQVTYFKLTGGRRIFKMAPLQHHFELIGWSETKIVLVFSLWAVLSGLLGLLGLANMGIR